MRYFIEVYHDDPILDIREAIVKAQNEAGLDDKDLTNLIVDFLPINFKSVLKIENMLVNR